MFFSFKEYLNFARFLVSRELTLQTRKREGCFAFAGNRVRTGHKNLETKVTRPSFFGGVPSYFEALWHPHLYFYRKFNT